MKILFVMRNTVYVRHFESVLRLLIDRGHHVHVAAAAHFLDHTGLTSRLSRECPGLTFGPLPNADPTGWAMLGEEIRCGIDYLRYLGPEYRDSPKLRTRAMLNAPPFVLSVLRRPLVDTPAGRRLLAAGLRFADRCLPREPAIDDFIAGHAPDLLLVTPLVEPGCPQSRFVRSARARDVRTALCVASWDNLTNKGLIQDALDLVTVWNPAMQREAVELHKVPPDRVAVTGSSAYDHWFTWTAATSREEFCATVGLPADRPYLLYLCSSKFIAPDEAPFVRRWVREIRGCSPVLRDTGVLVRPHPQNTDQWKGVPLADLDGVTVWPAEGRDPVDEESRSEYFDSIYHSAAVVGVNTSALIESAIVGRRVHTILAPEFRDTQEGTLHFRHLREAGGGLLSVANDFQEHASQLEQALRPTASDRTRADAFLGAFVRPHGLSEPATPRLVEALEQLSSRPPVGRERAPLGAAAVRRLMQRPAAARARALSARREDEARRARTFQAKTEALEARRAAKVRARSVLQQERQARLAERQRKQQLQDAEQAAVSRKRQAEGVRAFECYVTVRAHVEKMGRPERAIAAFGPREQEVIATARAIWNASPEMLSVLRHHAGRLGGTLPEQYTGSDQYRVAFFKDLRRLLKTEDPALLVQEPDLLGGFGFVTGQASGFQRFNDDTLRYFEILSALECGALVGACRNRNPRPVVWEFGGGWGGFAYQFKSLFPDSTYVMTAPPELLMFSAVYLMMAFPTAQFRFYDDTDPHGFWSDLRGADFAFAPESALEELPVEPACDLTLALDLQALERMSPQRARAHVEAAFRLRSRYIYSLGPCDRSPCGDLLRASVVIADRFWSYEVPVPRYPGMKVLAGFRGAGPADGVQRVHRIGWKRSA